MRPLTAILLLTAAVSPGHAPHGTLMWLDHGPLNAEGYFPDVSWDPSGEDGGSWYVAAYGSGIYHTRDAGESYRPTALEGPVSTVAAPWDRFGRVYAGTGRNVDLLGKAPSIYLDPPSVPGTGLYYSDNYGGSWQLTGFPRQPGTDLDYVSHVITAAGGDSVLAATYRRLFRSVDGGRSFEEAATLVEDESYHPSLHVDLVAHPRYFRVQYALLRERERLWWGLLPGSVTRRVLRSADGGAQWDTLWVGGEPAAGHRVGIAIAPSHPAIHWMIIDDGDYYRPLRAFRSVDHGETWQPVKMHEPEQYGRSYGPSYFHVHPWQPDTLLFGIDHGAFHPAVDSLVVNNPLSPLRRYPCDGSYGGRPAAARLGATQWFDWERYISVYRRQSHAGPEGAHVPERGVVLLV